MNTQVVWSLTRLGVVRYALGIAAGAVIAGTVLGAPTAHADDSHAGQHLECYADSTQNVFCDWYWDN